MRPAGAGTLFAAPGCMKPGAASIAVRAAFAAARPSDFSGAQAQEGGAPFVVQVTRHQQSMGTACHFGPEELSRHGQKKRHQRSGQHHKFTPAKNGGSQNKAFAPRLGRCRSANPCAHARRCAFAVWRGFAGVGGGGSVNPVRCRAVFAAAPHERLIVIFTSAPNGCVGTSIMPLCPQGAGTLKRHRRKA